MVFKFRGNSTPFLYLQQSYQRTAQRAPSFKTVNKLKFPLILGPRPYSLNIEAAAAVPLILNSRLYSKPEAANTFPLILGCRHNSKTGVASTAPLNFSFRPYSSKPNTVPNGEYLSIL